MKFNYIHEYWGPSLLQGAGVCQLKYKLRHTAPPPLAVKVIAKKMFNQDEEKMREWKQGDAFSAGQESRDCVDFISDVVICGIYLSLALGTAKFKQLD